MHERPNHRVPSNGQAAAQADRSQPRSAKTLTQRNGAAIPQRPRSGAILPPARAAFNARVAELLCCSPLCCNPQRHLWPHNLDVVGAFSLKRRLALRRGRCQGQAPNPRPQHNRGNCNTGARAGLILPHLWSVTIRLNRPFIFGLCVLVACVRTTDEISCPH